MMHEPITRSEVQKTDSTDACLASRARCVLVRTLSPLCLVSVLLVLVCSLVARAQDDLDGDWQTDGWSVAVAVTNGQARAVITYLDESVKSNFGFNVGDVSFTGKLTGSDFQGTMQVHYPVSMREKCAGRWSQQRALHLVLSPDHSALSGSWLQSTMSEGDCLESNFHQQPITFRRARRPFIWISAPSAKADQEP